MKVGQELQALREGTPLQQSAERARWSIALGLPGGRGTAIIAAREKNARAGITSRLRPATSLKRHHGLPVTFLDSYQGNVEVSIVQGKKVVTKVPAKVVDLDKAASNDAALLKQNGDGSTTLSGARFQGKKFALELGEASDGMTPGSSK